MLKEVFEQLGLSDNAHRVYVQLLENGASSARTLSQNLGIPRPSVYDTLGILIRNGLIIERNEENKKFFQIDDVEHLSRLLEERTQALERQQSELEKLLPTLLKGGTSVEPRIRFFTGLEGLKQIRNDILLYKNIETISMWPIREMIDLLGKEYFEILNRRRIKNKISIRAVWPPNRTVDFKSNPFVGTGPKHLRELRIGPKGFHSDMGYWIYADKVAFISSRKETFGFIIHSRDFAEMLKSQFEVLWNASTPIHSAPKDTEAFLKTIA